MVLSTFLSIAKTIFVLALVIALANISLKFVNRRMSRDKRMIKIIERVSVNNNSSINVVEVCGKFYFMSFTPQENKILKELNEEEIQPILGRIKEEREVILENKRYVNKDVFIERVKKQWGKRKRN